MYRRNMKWFQEDSIVLAVWLIIFLVCLGRLVLTDSVSPQFDISRFLISSVFPTAVFGQVWVSVLGVIAYLKGSSGETYVTGQYFAKLSALVWCYSLGTVLFLIGFGSFIQLASISTFQGPVALIEAIVNMPAENAVGIVTMFFLIACWVSFNYQRDQKFERESNKV